LVHDIGVSTSSIANVVQGSSLDGHVGRVDPSPACSGKLPALELADSLLEISAEVAPIVEIDVGVSSRAIHAVVRLLGSELNGAGLHRNKIITSLSKI
jgi:hypothetical protein